MESDRASVGAHDGHSFSEHETKEDLYMTKSSDNNSLSKRKLVKSVLKKTKEKAKEVLRSTSLSSKTAHEQLKDEDGDDLFTDAAFNPDTVVKEEPKNETKPGERVAHALKAAGNAINHPRQTIRNTVTRSAAGEISSASRTYLTSEEDRDLVEAYDALANAEDNATLADRLDADYRDSDVEKARKRVNELEIHRASLRTAWSLGRHTDRVRVVQRSRRMPRREECIKLDPIDGRPHFDRNKWLLELLLWATQGFTAHYIDDSPNLEDLPFDIQDLARVIERLAMISAPWQSFFVQVRKVYIWEDPKTTIKWMLLFWGLWYTEHIVGYFYFYIIYATIKNRLYPTSIDSVRDTLTRGVDREAKAQAWGELVQRHGNHDWIEPLLDDIGPILQLQTGDLSNFLEILANFYRWERPNKTAATLVFFAICLLVTLVADMAYCVKIVWFILGGAFFFTFPIATRFPRYRFVMNMLMWVFWDIPTHAELGITQLQEKAVLRDVEILERRVDEEDDVSSDYDTAPSTPFSSSPQIHAISNQEYTFRVRAENPSISGSGKVSGTFTVSRTGLKFSPYASTTQSTSLAIPYPLLHQMQKFDTQEFQSKLSKQLPMHRQKCELIFTYSTSDTDGSKSSIRERANLCSLKLTLRPAQQHEIFTLVLAWSNLRWQVLSVDRHEEGAEEGQSNVNRTLKRMIG